MRYRILGKTGLKVSVLGFGCMHLPMEKPGRVDRGLSTPMLRRAVELGVNFFDTGVMYCDGDSQAAMGDAFRGMREKVYISAKNPLGGVAPEVWRKTMEDSLKALQTDYLDLYNHHGISWDGFVKYFDPDKGGLTRELIRAKDQGIVKHIGFSFHDTPQNLIKLVDTGIYESVILQYNLLDQANADAIQHAHEKGMGVIVMGPVGGGKLGIMNEQVLELTGGAAKTTVEAAMRFVWGHPGVDIALSGMREAAMLEQNAALAVNAEPFTRKELDALNSLINERKKKSGLYCTACRYCIPGCAQKVDIPGILECYNQAKIFGFDKDAREQYGKIRVKATYCIDCGKCVRLCPQKISIPDRLKEAALLLDKQAGSVLYDASVDKLGKDGSFRMKISAYNLSDKSRPAGISLSSEGGMSLENPEINMPELKPLERKTVSAGGRLPLSAGRYGCSAQAPGGIKLPRLYDCLVIAKTGGGWQGGEWYTAGAKAGDFSGNFELAARHAFSFKLEYDGTSLLLYADVKDDFLFKTSRESHKGELCDGLEIYIDGREPRDIGRAAYEKGVYQVMAYPGTPGKYPAFFTSPQGIKDISLSAELTDRGYRMKAVIPFASFCAGKGVPDKIGFDLGANSADERGERAGQFIFAGSDNNWIDASGFIDVWLR